MKKAITQLWSWQFGVLGGANCRQTQPLAFSPQVAAPRIWTYAICLSTSAFYHCIKQGLLNDWFFLKKKSNDFCNRFSFHLCLIWLRHCQGRSFGIWEWNWQRARVKDSMRIPIWPQRSFETYIVSIPKHYKIMGSSCRVYGFHLHP